MSLSVIKRPQGYVLDSTLVTGVTVASSSGALFTLASHFLSTGDFIYIYSTLSAYNGYWYVNKNDANSFRIREYATASDQAFINSGGTIGYYKITLTHNWNCVHLPIVYKLKSDIWPTNSSDTARSITTFSNYNGYTYINASGDIKTTGTASSLEQVILSGTSVDGVYKIIQWFSDTNFVINLAYSASNVLSSGTVQYYYFNYCARIKIYAGITGTHTWAAQKPYALMTEQRMVPDSNGIITLNISEFIKKQLTIISNNSIKDTLPNNIDGWCNFYITYAESYDDSNMYTVSEFVSSYTDDSGTFEGYAVNAKLPFKTRSQGALSEYICGRLTNTSFTVTKAKFLTDFIRPSLFAGKYFDLSFINQFGTSGFSLKRELYKNNVIQSTAYDSVPSKGVGIYRMPVSQTSTEDRIDATVVITPTFVSLPGMANDGSFGVAWTLGSSPSVSLTIFDGNSERLYTSYAFVANLPYLISYNVTASSAQDVELRFEILDNTLNSIAQFSIFLTAPVSGNYSGTVGMFTSLNTGTKFSISIDQGVSTTTSVTVNSLTISGNITETKTIDVVSACSFTDFYLVWLNHLQGYDYWNFNAKRGKKYSIDVLESTTQDVNIFNTWPNSYGEFADSITKQTIRRSKNRTVVSSQLLTSGQEDAIKMIISSPLVQLCTSQYNRKTMIIAPNSLNVRQDKDKTLSITFTVSDTDELPTQKL